MISTRDAKLLNRLDIPAEHKEYVAGLWYDNPQHRSAWEVLLTWLLRALVPALCAVLIHTLVYPEMQLTPFLRLVSFIVWGCILCAPLLAGFSLLGFIIMAREPENLRAHLTKREGVCYVARRGTLGKVLVGFSMLLIILLVMVGWTITGLFYLMSWVSILAIHAVTKGAVRESIKGLYEHDRDRVREARNVTRPQIT